MRIAAFVLLAACGDPTSMPGDASNDGRSVDGPPYGGTCGLRVGQRSETNRMVHVGGLDRTYVVYLPPADAPNVPVPLVFVHHGYTMSGQIMFDITGYPALADAEHVALAFPDGEGGPDNLTAPWNVGTGVCPGTFGTPTASGDDFAFVDAMRADISMDQCLDLQHVYMTGFSMGGYFSHHAGCMRPDIRAVAPHSGGTHDLTGCTNAKEPIIIFHGTSDAVIPDGCDDPNGNTPNGVTPSALAWAQHNGCASTFTSTPVHNGTCIVFDSCPAGGQVELCTFDNMSHCWAGGLGTNVYACNDFASATQLEWDFFKQYAW